MKHKHITSQIMLACLSKLAPKKDIHAQLEETIAERKQIIQQMENYLQKARVIEMYLHNKKAA